MARYTHTAIMATFTEMITEMPFDKITVTELVRRCNISPNTFYYHYKDMYGLLNEWLAEGFKTFRRDNPTLTNWRDMAKAALRLCKQQEAITYHIYDGISRDALERFAFQTINDVVLVTVLRIAEQQNIQIPQDKLQTISEVCKSMLLGSFLRFMWGKMSEDIDSFVDSGADLVESLLKSEISKLPQA